MYFKFIFCVFVTFFYQSSHVFGNNFPKLQLVLIDKSNASNSVNFTLDQAKNISSHPLFNHLLTTVVYSFGYTKTLNDPLVTTIIASYSKNRMYNLIIVDYSAYSTSNLSPPSIPDYTATIKNVKQIGFLVGNALWNTFGMKLAINFQLVGHSLGAHLSAFINRAIANATDNSFHMKIPVIIGLDPAAPLFFPFGNSTTMNDPLKPSDAQIVYVIHTDSVYFGAPIKIGTIDFWPNGGSNQPGCPPFNPTTSIADFNNYCSHQRSVFYFSEAISNSNLKTFNAVKCNSWDQFKKKMCFYLPFNLNNMGLYPTLLTGDFYLQTSNTSPFSLGFKGMFYNATI
ncbi:hypothetical protein PVAND_016140 [Polypedilum vanderplanki]|uniref:Lipase domain-containing protein n=1 Tax=Polypedilum vanderplanki TaxID=319348 RepID=A0A9J6BFB3_POLVA|nr:hypothetical protein PVAND_016140 [Polypedilum vanderplanki]